MKYFYMMKHDLKIKQIEQKIYYSCVPACLEQVLSHYKIKVNQKEILATLKMPKRGMSIPAAGSYLIKSGLNPLTITNNINIFDCGWIKLENVSLIEKLIKRKKYLDAYNKSLVDDYLQYLRAGGEIGFQILSANLIGKFLSKNIPIIAELASNILYGKSKSTEAVAFDDPIKGDIDGHAVVIAGFNKAKGKFKIIDPDSRKNTFSKRGIYWIDSDLLLASIFNLDGKSILIVNRKTIKN